MKSVMKPKRKRGRPAHEDILTPAEWRTVHAAQHGMTNRKIASRRGISLDAVKFHIANALGKLGLENRKMLLRWFAVPVDSALGKQGNPMNKNIALGAIGQISRSVSDLPAAEAWYRDVLGLTHLYTFGDLAFFDCGGTRLFLSVDGRGPTNAVIYFRVDDIGAAYEGLLSRNVEFKSPPHLIHRHGDGTEEWMAFFKDPDGGILAIMSQVRPQQ